MFLHYILIQKHSAALEGVYAELAGSINRLVDHIGYVLRMETESERRMLLERLIDIMPSMVRFALYFTLISIVRKALRIGLHEQI